MEAKASKKLNKLNKLNKIAIYLGVVVLEQECGCLPNLVLPERTTSLKRKRAELSDENEGVGTIQFGSVSSPSLSLERVC